MIEKKPRTRRAIGGGGHHAARGSRHASGWHREGGKEGTDSGLKKEALAAASCCCFGACLAALDCQVQIRCTLYISSRRCTGDAALSVISEGCGRLRTRAAGHAGGSVCRLEVGDFCELRGARDEGCWDVGQVAMGAEIHFRL